VNGHFAGLPEHGIFDFMLDGKSCRFSFNGRGGNGYGIALTASGRSDASQGILGGSSSGENDLGLLDSSFCPDFSGISPVPEPVCALSMGSALLRIFLGGRRFSPCKKNHSAVA